MDTVVSVAFREPYLTHSKRQQDVCKEQGITGHYYMDELPHKDGIEIDVERIITRFQQSLYGFKVHAIEQMRRLGYTKVVWFDPSTLPTCDVNILFKSLDEHPIIVRTGEHPISKMCNKKSVNWFGLTDADLEGHNHIGGTVYGFNFWDTLFIRK